MLVEVVAKGGNLLLGIGPDDKGEIPLEVEKRLYEIGNWLSKNGEAIYGTRPIYPFAGENVRFTAKGNKIFCIVIPDKSGKLPAAVKVEGLMLEENTSPLAFPEYIPLSFKKGDDGFFVELPAHAKGTEMPYVFVFKHKGVR